MRILHVLTSPRAEGTPRLALDWLGVTEHDHQVLFMNSSPSDLTELFKEKTSHVIVNKQIDSNIRKRIFQIPNLVYKTCRTIKPDMVVAWNQPNVHLILLGAKLAGVKKLIGHAGCLPEKNAKTGWAYTYFVFYSILMLGAKVICPSYHILHTFFKVPFFPKRTLVRVPNAINIERFERPPHVSKPVKHSAIYVANLEAAKDHAVLIQAWRLVLNDIPGATLKLAGGGSLDATLKELSCQLGCGQSIEFLGACTNIPDLLWQNEVFVFPSKNVEGFGTVLIEALAAGLKIVSFNEPAPREVLESGEYGTLVPERDAMQFAQAIINAFNTAKVTVAPLQYLQMFRIENMVHSYIQTAEKL